MENSNNKPNMSSCAMYMYALRGVGYLLLIFAIFEWLLCVVGTKGIDNAINLSELTVEDVKTGVFVEGDIRYSGGAFASKEFSTNGVVTSTKNYYVIPFGENSDRFMGFQTGISEEAIEQLDYQSMQYFEGKADEISTTMSVSGILIPIVGELKTHYQTFMGELSEEMYVNYFLYEMDQDMLLRMRDTVYWLLGIGGAMSIISCLVLRKMAGDVSRKEKLKMLRNKAILFWILVIVAIPITLFTYF